MNGEELDARLSLGPLVADGGMGTSLIDLGAPVDACLESLTLSDRATVQRVHADFVGAGADLVVTNTFGASSYRLQRHGLAGRVPDMCDAAVAAARAAGPELVGGSIGPLGVRLAPYGRVRTQDAFDAYLEQARALVDAGVDLLVIETQTDVREIEVAVLAARDASPTIAIVASAAFTRDDRTLLGDTPTIVAQTLARLDVDVIGANCGEGPAQVLRVLDAMSPHARGKPLVARPNAGGPAEIGGRFVYPATPEYFGDVTQAFLEEGALLVGGCCGTGPAHVAAVASAVRRRRPRVRVVPPDPSSGAVDVAERASAADAGSDLKARLERGAFTIAVEMEPPRSSNAAGLVAAAATLREAGADVIDVADSPMAKMRMSPWAACRLIRDGTGVETVLHFPTRGRNILRLQGDLLGAHALGIRNLFICIGDPVTIGDYPHGSNNVDVTATGLLSLVDRGFNVGVDRAGSSIGEPTAFVAGAAISPAAPDLEREARLLRKKVEAGARFLLSQPLYSAEPLRALRNAYAAVAGDDLRVPVLAGILPLSSARHASFLHNEVPGVDIPETVRERMTRARNGDAAWRTGLDMATALAAELADDGVSGVYVMPQFGRYDRAADVVESVRRIGGRR